MAERAIPFLWFRLFAILGFFIFVMFKGMPIVALISIGLFVLTAVQLRDAYRSKSPHKQQ